MKRTRVLLIIAALAVGCCIAAAGVSADNGNASPSLSFFSGGDGAQAHWFTTADQPPGDADNQAIALNTTDGAPTYAKGYAGILVHHVTGIPAAAFPDSEFWVKATNYSGASLGSPRLWSSSRTRPASSTATATCARRRFRLPGRT